MIVKKHHDIVRERSWEEKASNVIFLLHFKYKGLHFHFAPRLANYVADSEIASTSLAENGDERGDFGSSREK